jgi:hypothetical protein
MAQQRARLSWKDDSGSGFIQVDVIPQLESTQSSTVTEFPLEDGSIVSDHIIHHPDLLRLEISQTQIPFVDSDDDGNDIEFVKASIPLELPKTRFQAKGLLFLTLQAEGALGAAAGAITGALGLGGGKTPLAIEIFRPPYDERDRINDLFDKLTGARLRGAMMTLDWLGRRWTNYYIEQINYTRSKGRQIGEFSLSMKQVQTVSTATASLPSPAEARLKLGVNGGNRPAKKTGDVEKANAGASAKKSLLKQLLDEMTGGE